MGPISETKFLQNKWLVAVFSLLVYGAVVFLDLVTGEDLSFSLFYFIPIYLAAWYGDLGLAMVIVVLAVASRALLDIHWDDDKRPVAILIWNLVSRALIQTLCALLIVRLKATLVRAQQARQDAEEATRAKSKFLATMSHEIRTPLNSILAMAELLDRSSLDPQQRVWVKIFRKEGGHLLALLNDLLDFSKIEARQYRLEIASFSLPGLLQEVQSILGVLAAEKAVVLGIDAAPTLPARVSSDPTALRRVLFNLVGNAIKFTDEGNVLLEVSRRPEARGGEQLLFSVIDTGSGIAADQLESIFQPFVQARSPASRDVAGTGLGLSIVRELVELMGGKVQVASTPGVGSRFDFFVPLVEAAEAPSDEAVPGVELRVSEASPLSLLVADDYPTNRMILREFLKDTPYRITEVENGRQAVEAVKQKDFSLVLMDVKMPVMDGYEAVRRIRTWEKEAGKEAVPIVALTAQSFREDVLKALGSGFQAHLAKPMERRQLMAVIGQWARAATETGPERSELDELTQRYLDEVAQFHIEAVNSLEAGDWTLLESIGHRLRGSGGVFGFAVLTEIGTELETAAASGSRSTTASAVEKLTNFQRSQEAQR